MSTAAPTHKNPIRRAINPTRPLTPASQRIDQQGTTKIKRRHGPSGSPAPPLYTYSRSPVRVNTRHWSDRHTGHDHPDAITEPRTEVAATTPTHPRTSSQPSACTAYPTGEIRSETLADGASTVRGDARSTTR